MRAVLVDGAHGAERRQTRVTEVLDVFRRVEVTLESGVVHLEDRDDCVRVEERVVTVVGAAVLAVVDAADAAMVLRTDLLLPVLTHVTVHLRSNKVQHDYRDLLLPVLTHVTVHLRSNKVQHDYRDLLLPVLTHVTVHLRSNKVQHDYRDLLLPVLTHVTVHLQE